MFLKAEQLVYSNPDEAIKIVSHLLKKSQDLSGFCTLNLLMSRSYLTKGDYVKSLTYAYEADSNLQIGDSLKAETLFLKAEIAGKLNLNKLSGNYKKSIKPLMSASNRNFFNERLNFERVITALETRNYKESLKILTLIPEDNSIRKEVLLAKGLANLGLGNNKKAFEFYSRAFKAYTEEKIPDKTFEIKALNAIAGFYYADKRYAESIALLMQSLDISSALGNIAFQKEITLQIANNYLTMNDMVNYRVYFDKYVLLDDQITEVENDAVNLLYELIGNEQKNAHENSKERLSRYAIIIFGILGLIIVSGSIFYVISRNRKKQLKEIIGYLEVSNNLLIKSYATKKAVVKKIAISSETEQAILEKLRNFESSGSYTSKDMSLATLAAQLDVNTKYLSEIINKHYNGNFNTYINRLRINYIIEKLKTEPEYLNYKISYLAETSGFSSHSSFATIFKTITGIAPTVFIELLSREVNTKKA